MRGARKMRFIGSIGLLAERSLTLLAMLQPPPRFAPCTCQTPPTAESSPSTEEMSSSLTKRTWREAYEVQIRELQLENAALLAKNEELQSELEDVKARRLLEDQVRRKVIEELPEGNEVLDQLRTIATVQALDSEEIVAHNRGTPNGSGKVSRAAHARTCARADSYTRTN